MSGSWRASVSSQTAVQPLILATARTSSSMSRHSSLLSKRDSGLEFDSLGHRKSVKKQRPVSDSEANQAMAPTYRLYPQQASTGRRSLRAMETSPDTNHSFAHDLSKNAELNTTFGRRAEYHDHHDISRRSSAEDDDPYMRSRHESLPTEMLTPDGDGFEKSPVSPVASDIDNRFDSAAGSRNNSRPPRTEYGVARSHYGHGVSQEDLRYVERPHVRSHSRASSTTQRQPLSAAQRRPSYTKQGASLARKPSESQTKYRHSPRPSSPEMSSDNAYGPGERSSGESIMTEETAATSITNLPALQSKGPDNSDAQQLEPVLEDDPRSWDLVEPVGDAPQGIYVLEKRAEQMFSSEHLRAIFNDPKLLLKFTGFLNAYRPKSIAILIYYMDALKAIRAIEYANAIAEALEPIRGQNFTREGAAPTRNQALEDKANAAFNMLVQEDLPAFIAHTWTQVVSVSIQRRITGTLAPHLREASEGLAEVFCLTDPSRPDNPIVFASEEFVRTTQYGVNYVIGRNCRFLQGPRTNPNSVRRLAMNVAEGREHTEVFVNYRRDGSPFMNLLMTAPLMDSRGNIRYYIGAQVDVSNLVKECSSLDGLWKMAERQSDPEAAAEDDEENKKDEFQELTEMFNSAELDTVRRFGGRMHKEYVDDSDRESIAGGKRRVLIKDSTEEVTEKHAGKSSAYANIPTAVREKSNGKLAGVYQNYLLIRPAPSLRILFTSPSLRVPGILQSPFLDRIGGSSRVRSDLRAALGDGRGVTAKIRWLARPDKDGEGDGRPRWIHCTPLFGHSGAVGVWMVVLVDDDNSNPNTTSSRRFRAAPPVANNIGGKEWDALAAKDAKEKRQNHYDAENERRGGQGLRPEIPKRLYSNMSQETQRIERHVPGSSHSNVVNGVASGDVSEFSFQLK